LITSPGLGKVNHVKAKETEKANIYLDQKESADTLREITLISKLAEEPDWESLVKKQMFKWVIVYGGAMLVAATLIGFIVFVFLRAQ